MAAEGGNFIRNYRGHLIPIVRFTYTGADGEVIPDEATHIFVQTRKVLAEAFRYHPNIVELICHENVEKLESDAFYCCPNLRRVIMPGVKVAEVNAFHHCDALEYVECDKLEIIEEDAFSWCMSLRSINLPSARIVDKDAFKCCVGLRNVKFGSKLERVGGSAFEFCSSLERITIPLKDGLITRDNIFVECDSLHQVDLVEREVHETIAALHLEEWRDDMNEEIDSIEQILPNADSGRYDDDVRDPGEKARAIRSWMRSVFNRLNHYKAEHHNLLKEAATLLELALWKANLDENGGGKLASEGVRTTRGSRKRARKEICVTSGASIVIKNVLPFLQLLE